MTQVVEHMHEALTSNPSNTKAKQKKNRGNKTDTENNKIQVKVST
jgi:hypothetical protein